MKLIFGVFITGLLAATMVFGENYTHRRPVAWIAGEDMFSQTVAGQANANGLVLAAKELSASLPAESENWGGPLPGSMASNAGSPATENNIFNETVAIEANANRLVLKAIKF